MHWQGTYKDRKLTKVVFSSVPNKRQGESDFSSAEDGPLNLPNSSSPYSGPNGNKGSSIGTKNENYIGVNCVAL